MSELFACPQCHETYFIYEGEDDLCAKCKARLQQVCEWCMAPESECKCGKDSITQGKE